MKAGDRVKLVPKTRTWRNILQNRGELGTVEKVSHVFFADGEHALIRFDKGPRRPTRVVEETIAAWQAQESPERHAWIREYCYRTEYDMWVPLGSKELDIQAG